MEQEAIETAQEARDKAIEWQHWASEQAMSWGEVAGWSLYFTALKQQFPELAEEFEENGIA